MIDGSGSVRPVHWARARRRVTAALGEFGLEVDVSGPVSGLTAGQRAVLALARAVRHVRGEGGILVLDEPTASLDRDGVDLLFHAVARLRERGAGVVFVGHNLEEALRLCDEVTVLRDGEVVLDAPTEGLDESALIRAILGRDIGSVYPVATTRPTEGVVLSVEGLTGDLVRGVSFAVHTGEILGVTGLAGMGHDEIPQLVFGHHRPVAGEVRVAGRALPADPARCLDEGVVLISGDRKRVGADSSATVAENVSLPVTPRYYRRGRLSHARVRDDVERMLRQFDVRPPRSDLQMGQLSGGNQQKAVVGKWLSVYGRARVLLLAEPVHGVDVAARQAIFRHIREAADRGIAVLYVSSEHDDLAHLCDRVLVMRHGTVRSELGGDALTAHDLTAACLRSGV
jgi:ribose transport system ATP-binding protein